MVSAARQGMSGKQTKVFKENQVVTQVRELG